MTDIELSPSVAVISQLPSDDEDETLIVIGNKERRRSEASFSSTESYEKEHFPDATINSANGREKLGLISDDDLSSRSEISEMMKKGYRVTKLEDLSMSDEEQQVEEVLKAVDSRKLHNPNDSENITNLSPASDVEEQPVKAKPEESQLLQLSKVAQFARESYLEQDHKENVNRSANSTPLRIDVEDCLLQQSNKGYAGQNSPCASSVSLPPPSPSSNGNRNKPPSVNFSNNLNKKLALGSARSFEDVPCFSHKSPNSASAINVRIHPPSQKVNIAPVIKMRANVKDTNVGKASPSKKSHGSAENHPVSNRGAFAARAAAKKGNHTDHQVPEKEIMGSIPSLSLSSSRSESERNTFLKPISQAILKAPATQGSVTSLHSTSSEYANMSQGVRQDIGSVDNGEEFSLPPPDKELNTPPKKTQEMIVLRSDPDNEEQALFESKLTEDPMGIAVRKISSSGKSQLRYVKCIGLSNSPAIAPAKKRFSSATSIHSSMSLRSVGTKSVTRSVGLSSAKRRLQLTKSSNASNGGSRSVVSAANSEDEIQNHNLLSSASSKRRLALTWGNKTKVVVGLEKFTCVRKGKGSDRTKRSTSPASHLLSVLTDDPSISLDIEAPTRTDRDKFASAFARFLCVPLETENQVAEPINKASTSATVAEASPTRSDKKRINISSARTAPGSILYEDSRSLRLSTSSLSEQTGFDSNIPSYLSPIQSISTRDDLRSFSLTEEDNQQISITSSQLAEKQKHSDEKDLNQFKTLNVVPDPIDSQAQDIQHILNSPVAASQAQDIHNFLSSTAAASQSRNTAAKSESKSAENEEELSTVSSLTAGFEHEIVDELHQVIQELRAELEASRAEAGRAVKVAEQAIQSAESCNSNDWNSTVTHKAAEAAAQAQKRAAEAMARQRLAEEKLAGERRAARFWRDQAESAEQDAGVLQTRAAAAEVQREAIFLSLELEQRRAKENMVIVRSSMDSRVKDQGELVESEKERCRRLEIELDRVRLFLASKNQENQMLQVQLHEMKTHKPEKKKMGLMSRKKKTLEHDEMSQDEPAKVGLLSAESDTTPMHGEPNNLLRAETIMALHKKSAELKLQFELFKSYTSDQIKELPKDAFLWSKQVGRALTAANAEVDWLKEKLAVEIASRRKIRHQVLNYRGTVRVFCRPRPTRYQGLVDVVSVPSHDTIAVHVKSEVDGVFETMPIGFEFDHVFPPECPQHIVFEEIESLVFDSLEGFAVCIMVYGQSQSGKSYTLMRDSSDDDDKGLFFSAVDQIFSVSKKRSDRYQDNFNLTMLEVQDERLQDLIVGTHTANTCGERLKVDVSLKKKNKQSRVVNEEAASFSSSTPLKLEIKSNIDGDTVVHGLTSVPIASPEDVRRVWTESEELRAARAKEQFLSGSENRGNTHTFLSINLVSTNIATGITTLGKLQFVELAPADRIIPSSDLKSTGSTKRDQDFVNKSLNTLNSVVDAKRQFVRSVPFRNSTLTHLLRDALEGDSKVLMLCCVSSDLEDIEQTTESLKFASKMRKVPVGVATKKTLSLAGRNP